jgi:DNA-directed RNA polymerase subunit beta'
LIGLKENVLLGKLIPAGTGMKRYRDVKLDTELRNTSLDEEEIALDEEEDIIFSEEIEEELFDGADDTEENTEETLEEPVLATEE